MNVQDSSSVMSSNGGMSCRPPLQVNIDVPVHALLCIAGIIGSPNWVSLRW